MADFETFPDPLLSLYQSAAAEVGRRMDQRTSPAGGVLPHQAIAFQQSSASRVQGFATDIARQEYDKKRGITPPARPPVPPPVPPIVTHELTVTDQLQVCASIAYRYMQAAVAGHPAALAAVKAELDKGVCDPLWATTIDEYLRYYGIGGHRNAVPYRRAAQVGPGAIAFGANARIAVVGDWGTGEQPAITILEQIAAAKPDILIHLGDIYYSGTPEECQVNFLQLLTQTLRRDNAALPVFTLSGNHDMYSGGVGYYGLIDQLNAPPYQQKASFFCLRSTDQSWQLMAMDTGYHDNNPLSVNNAVTFLEPDELAWHHDRIREFPGRTILLSHHQLFSAFSAIGGAAPDGKRQCCNPKLLDAFQQWAADGRIAAWFWGHEHTLSIYQGFSALARGRCLGHGAVPVSVADDIYKVVDGLDQVPASVAGTVLGTEGGVYAHGFAIVDLRAEDATVTYFQDIGGTATKMYAEVIS